LDSFADFWCVSGCALFLLPATSEYKGKSQQSNDGERDVLHLKPPQNVCGIVWFEYAGKSMSWMK
jgi:hypothetical protein